MSGSIAGGGSTFIIARPVDETCRQAILLRHSSAVRFKGNTLNDPDGHTKPDASSQSHVLGLVSTRNITIDGKRLEDSSGTKSAPTAK